MIAFQLGCKSRKNNLDTRLGGDQQDGFDTDLSTLGRDRVVLGLFFAHLERSHRTSTSLPM